MKKKKYNSELTFQVILMEVLVRATTLTFCGAPSGTSCLVGTSGDTSLHALVPTSLLADTRNLYHELGRRLGTVVVNIRYDNEHQIIITNLLFTLGSFDQKTFIHSIVVFLRKPL